MNTIIVSAVTAAIVAHPGYVLRALWSLQQTLFGRPKPAKTPAKKPAKKPAKA